MCYSGFIVIGNLDQNFRGIIIKKEILDQLDKIKQLKAKEDRIAACDKPLMTQNDPVCYLDLIGGSLYTDPFDPTKFGGDSGEE